MAKKSSFFEKLTGTSWADSNEKKPEKIKKQIKLKYLLIKKCLK